MKNRVRIFLRLILLLLTSSAAAPTSAELAVIANPDNPLSAITISEVTRIYLGKTRLFPSGERVTPVDQAEDRYAREHFYQAVAEMDNTAVKQYWSRLMFSGKGYPPETLSDNESVRNWVAEHASGLGYIDRKFADKSVKVLLIIP
jgi:ABC-type phosphate transport system substrate-binding protein